MKLLSIEDFQPLLGQAFRLEVEDGGRLELLLTEVNPGSERIRAQLEEGERTPFSLIFRSEPEVQLPQHLYRLEHSSLGPLDIFLVPIGPDKQGMCYEAVFA